MLPFKKILMHLPREVSSRVLPARGHEFLRVGKSAGGVEQKGKKLSSASST